MTVGQRIKMKREEAGLTQSELAKRMSVTYQLISSYERDVVDGIPMPRLQEIASILGCSPYWLMEGVTEEEGLTAAKLRLIARIKAATPEEADKIEDIVNIVLGKAF